MSGDKAMVDPDSQTWRAVASWAAGEIETAQRSLAAFDLPSGPTERARAVVATLGRLLDLAKPKAALTAEKVHYPT